MVAVRWMRWGSARLRWEQDERYLALRLQVGGVTPALVSTRLSTMFTGIIEEVGRVAAVQQLEGGRRLRLAASFAPELRVDQSVAVNGACLTVVGTDGEAFEVVAVEETLAKTNVGALAEGDRVNLERAMRPDGRLDGHLVQGHVDATG